MVTSDISSLPIEQQMRYVRRDSELAMLLAQYNNCLALRIMKIFAGYAKMDYYLVCHTEISTWYANRYRKMLESGECTITSPNYKLNKQAIGGGHHTSPTQGFFIGTKIYELDVKGQYPSIVINNNFSFDTLNCSCCKYNESARVRQETIDTINEQLQENEKDELIIKGVDGLSDSNPLWIQKWFKKIVVEMVKHPETRFEVVPKIKRHMMNWTADALMLQKN